MKQEKKVHTPPAVLTDVIESETAETDGPTSGERESPTLPQDQSTEEPRRSDRQQKQPIRYPEQEVYTSAMMSAEETLTFNELCTLPANDQVTWRHAMTQEIASMHRNEVWKLEDPPPDSKPVSCRWILKKKANGTCKARLVAPGFQLREGIDYKETFAPVISYPALRIIFILILVRTLYVHVLDVKAAFLNGELKDTIYMCQPEGFDDHSGKVCKLLKSIYGLKYAPHIWYHKFTELMFKRKFKALENEPCIFM